MENGNQTNSGDKMRSKLNFLIVIILFISIGYLSLTYVSPDITRPQGVNITHIGHMIAYFILSGSLLIYFRDKPYGYKEAVSISAFYGLFLELVQFRISYRTFSGIDVILNTSGSSLIFLNLKFDLVSRFIKFEDSVLNYIFGKS